MLEPARMFGKALTYISIALMLLLSIPITYEAIARAFGAPTIWVFETTLYAFIFLGFLGNALAVRTGAHFRVTLLRDMYPALRRPLDLFAQLCTLGFALLIIAAGSYFAWNSFSKGILAATMLEVPLFIPQLAIPLGGLGLFMQTLVMMLTGEEVSNPHVGD
ncbi:TRAP transporter small permease [Brevirhabdus sp.]|uniref:TRAP transporter small permease n=1 Tax=Brevirhabdus sp. TaxID=2004514 RepID=UPI004058105E